MTLPFGRVIRISSFALILKPLRLDASPFSAHVMVMEVEMDMDEVPVHEVHLGWMGVSFHWIRKYAEKTPYPNISVKKKN